MLNARKDYCARTGHSDFSRSEKDLRRPEQVEAHVGVTQYIYKCVIIIFVLLLDIIIRVCMFMRQSSVFREMQYDLCLYTSVYMYICICVYVCTVSVHTRSRHNALMRKCRCIHMCTHTFQGNSSLNTSTRNRLTPTTVPG